MIEDNSKIKIVKIENQTIALCQKNEDVRNSLRFKELLDNEIDYFRRSIDLRIKSIFNKFKF